MTRFRIIALSALLALSGSACAHQPPGPTPTPLRIVCTVATPWDPERCWVEFGPALIGPRVETASRAAAEELVAVLLSKPGAVYVFDDGLTPAKGGPAQRKPRERFGQGDAK